MNLEKPKNNINKRKLRKERQNTLLEIRSYSEEQYDKLIVFLSSGALVITVGFVNNIINITDDINIKPLIASWIMFAASLFSILISHITSKYSIDYEFKGKRKKSDYFNKITEVLNWSATFILIIGIGFFMYFVGRNLSHG